MDGYVNLKLCVIILFTVQLSVSLNWDSIHCSKDTDQIVNEGEVTNIGRYPWLGVIQHNFYIGGAVRFAITAAVLIHPKYAIAPAEDIARILRDQLQNNTKFIIWYSSTVKYAMAVNDYVLHPEYEERNIVATLALLELQSHGETTVGENPQAVLPVCMPIAGMGFLGEMYAVKMTDNNSQLQKEIHKMQYINDNDCNTFYNANNLTLSKMAPVSALCASVVNETYPCVWDGGVALITRQAWGFWKILGFSVRGPGCAAPARFLVIHDYLPWIHEVLSRAEMEDEEEAGEGQEVFPIGFRRISPMAILMFSVSKIMPTDYGFCTRQKRGAVIYKEVIEASVTKDFAQGFFYVIVTQLAKFNCGIVKFQDVTVRSSPAIWLEHSCHRELTGIAHGQSRPRDYKKQECFMYFKSAAFVHFRFYFSFKTKIECILYGDHEIPRYIPNPWMIRETTDAWYPTDGRLRWDSFVPINMWFWHL